MQSWQGVRKQLESVRWGIDEQIENYPGPILACDEQFNHLLDQRNGVHAELARLNALVETPIEESVGSTVKKPEVSALIDPRLAAFLRTCPFLDDETGGKFGGIADSPPGGHPPAGGAG